MADITMRVESPKGDVFYESKISEPGRTPKRITLPVEVGLLGHRRFTIVIEIEES